MIKTMVTYFPECEDIHLVKDVGTIPYEISKKGVEATIITLDHGPYHHTEKARLGLKIQLVKHPLLGLFSLFRKKKYDVFQVYHYTMRSMLAAIIYRFYHPGGVLCLKLDTDNPRITTNNITGLFCRLARFNVVTGEHEHTTFDGKPVVYVPGMIDTPEPRPVERENIVLHVGRLGLPEKQTELAIREFRSASQLIPGWRMLLAGEMMPGFREFYQTVKAGNIEYLGYIGDREQLYSLYNKAKIIYMPSLSESFGLAVVEAMSLGCILVGTDIPAYREHTANGGYGFLNPDNLSVAMNSDLTDMREYSTEYVRNRYDKEKIINRLWKALNESTTH